MRYASSKNSKRIKKTKYPLGTTKITVNKSVIRYFHTEVPS